MTTYYNVVLVVFRAAAVVWFFQMLVSVLTMLVSLGAMKMSSDPVNVPYVSSGLSMTLVALLLPLVAYFAAPFLAHLSTRGLHR